MRGVQVEPDDPAGDWTAPGVYRVTDDVYRVPLPLPGDGLRAVNVYVVVTPDGPTLIDAGWALSEARRDLTAALAALGAGLGDITQALVTHLHRDHFTQAVALRSELGIPFALGRGEKASLDRLSDPAWAPLSHQLAELEASGAGELAERFRALHASREPQPTDAKEFWQPPDRWLDDGTVLDVGAHRLTALATPGHTRGHVVYRDSAAGLLFAGDHVLPHITPSIGFEPVPMADPLGHFLASLRALRQLPDQRLLPAHGPLADSVHHRVDELIGHHDRRLAATLAAVAAGSQSAWATARALTWTRHGRHLDELDLFNQMLAVLETGAHLELLARQARLADHLEAGERRYRLP